MIDLLEHLETALAGRYALHREIGRGAQAAVYLARDTRHERMVALKVLRPELAALLGADGFLREIKLTAQLQHPHILPLYDSGEVDGALYYVTPYVTGESLRGRLSREWQLDINEAARIAREVGEALDYAHRRGIVHRDIKPDNILLGEDGHALVADFGIARALERATGASNTGTRLVLGTPAYMSPEQAMGERELDGRSDIYSLGCVLYEMLSGRPPFTGSTAQATIAKRFAGPPASVGALRSAVPPQLAKVVERSLAAAPAHRFESARAFSDALRSPGSSAAPGSHAPARDPPVKLPDPRRFLLLGVGSVLLVGAIVARVLSGGPAPLPPSQGAAVAAPAAAPVLDRKRVTVVDFENQTGDAALDPVGRMAADWIIHGLVQTGLVDLVDTRSAVRRVKRVSVRGDSVAAPDLQSLIDATKAGTVISGSYYRENDSLRFEARIDDARTGEVVTTIESPPAPVREPTRVIDELRQRVMGSLATILDARFREWSRIADITPTYAAFREFADGVDYYQRGDMAAATEHLTRASALDTSFHLAQLWAVQAYGNRLEVRDRPSSDDRLLISARDSLLAALRAAREHLGPLDRTLLEYLIAGHSGDQNVALRYGRQLAALWPDRYAFNAATTALRVNRPREAVALLRRADPVHGFMRGWSSYWTTLTFAEHELGWHSQELADAERARQLNIEEDYSIYFQLRALAALGRSTDAMALAAATDTMGSGELDTWWPVDEWLVLANELRAHGQGVAARQAAERGVNWVMRRPAIERSTWEHQRPLCALFYAGEFWDEAWRACSALESAHPGDPDALLSLASLAARRGDREAAERFALRLGHANLDGWPGTFYPSSNAAAAAQLVQLARAHIAAITGRREEAVRLLHAESARWMLFDPLTNQLDWDPDFASLRGYPPFEALRRPDG